MFNTFVENVGYCRLSLFGYKTNCFGWQLCRTVFWQLRQWSAPILNPGSLSLTKQCGQHAFFSSSHYWNELFQISKRYQTLDQFKCLLKTCLTLTNFLFQVKQFRTAQLENRVMRLPWRQKSMVIRVQLLKIVTFIDKYDCYQVFLPF